MGNIIDGEFYEMVDQIEMIMKQLTDKLGDGRFKIRGDGAVRNVWWIYIGGKPHKRFMNAVEAVKEFLDLVSKA